MQGLLAVSEQNYRTLETGVGRVRRRDITLRENIDSQIERIKAELTRVEETKVRLEKSGLLDTRIDDLEIAVHW